MIISEFSSRFKRNYKKLSKINDLSKLDHVIFLIASKTKLPEKYKDHQLRGELAKYRDCHVENDWILIYELGTNKNNEEFVKF